MFQETIFLLSEFDQSNAKRTLFSEVFRYFTKERWIFVDLVVSGHLSDCHSMKLFSVGYKSTLGNPKTFMNLFWVTGHFVKIRHGLIAPETQMVEFLSWVVNYSYIIFYVR